MNNQSTGKKILIGIGISALLLLAICGLFSNSGSSSSSDTKRYKDDVRCYYCSKVIRANGRNIHGTPIYNGGVLVCDYCGHETSIKA